MENKFYVYEWYNKNTNHVFYVGKGCGKRYKEVKHRNQKFLDYILENEVDSKIIEENLSEQEALALEKITIENYKKDNQCECNLMEGGHGGLSQVWTKEMKEYWSENNPMKSEEQRERMKQNNPMKNPEIAKKNGQSQMRPVVINGVEYAGGVIAAEALKVCAYTIQTWCQRGYDTKGNPCRYADEEQKDFIIPRGSKKAVLIDGIYYDTVKEAAFALGATDSSPLCRALKQHKKYKGHTCEYVNQQPS